jgi:hypothetical protein
MNAFLDAIITAHGGLARWQAFSQVQATIVTGGTLWGTKGLVQDPQPRRMTVALHEQRASLTPFGAADQRTAYTPGRIAIKTTGGDVVAERRDPRLSFAGHQLNTPWDPLHRAYFNGYALWTYLTTPFLLVLPGVQVQEIAPWTERDERWRRLRARFPADIATHSEEQDFFFGPDLLLRRHDYRVDIAGAFAAAQLTHNYTQVQGLKMPTRRLAYTRGAEDAPDLGKLMVSIDISDIGYT